MTIEKLEPWPIDGSRVINTTDYIYSMLIDTPEMYFIVPGMPFMYLYIIDRGIVLVRCDLRGRSQQEIEALIRHLRRTL